MRGEAAITASAPAPSALRRTAPRLPGFSTPSMTTSSGSPGKAQVIEVERRRPDDRDEPLGAVAEGQLGERRLGRRGSRHAARSRARRAPPARPRPRAAARRRTTSTTSTPASSARRSSRAPSTRVRPRRVALAPVAQARGGLDPRVRWAGERPVRASSSSCAVPARVGAEREARRRRRVQAQVAGLDRCRRRATRLARARPFASWSGPGALYGR